MGTQGWVLDSIEETHDGRQVRSHLDYSLDGRALTRDGRVGSLGQLVWKALSSYRTPVCGQHPVGRVETLFGRRKRARVMY